MSAARVGVIGARRRRQGLGPFVVRDLCAAGAEVPCFLATSASSRDAAERELAERCGVEARGYADLDRMLACESLDALAILSPAESHAQYLAAALDAKLHTLCEKPFVWGRLDLAASAARFAAEFAERGLLLFENCQWPYTLPAYRTLHPEALAQPPRRFEMLLQPASRGLQMLGDCVPHALSLLQAAAAGAQSSIEKLRYRVAGPDADHIRLEFVFRTELAEIRSVVDLEHRGNHPRRHW